MLPAECRKLMQFQQSYKYTHLTSQAVDTTGWINSAQLHDWSILGGGTKKLIAPFASTFILDQDYIGITCLYAHIPVTLEIFFSASSSISSSRWQNVSASGATSLNANLNSFHWYSQDPSPFTEPRTLASTSNPFISTDRRKASFMKIKRSAYLHIRGGAAYFNRYLFV